VYLCPNIEDRDGAKAAYYLQGESAHVDKHDYTSERRVLINYFAAIKEKTNQRADMAQERERGQIYLLQVTELPPPSTMS